MTKHYQKEAIGFPTLFASSIGYASLEWPE